MSFRSAWRHAAKTSPSTPHIAPSRIDSSTNNSGLFEPTLVVTSSRPPSVKDSKPINTALLGGQEQGAENAVETQPECSVKKDDEENGKGHKEEKKQLAPRDARWFTWWSNAKSEAPSASKPTERMAIESPRNAPEPSTTTTVETTTISAIAPAEETSTPTQSQPLEITPSPQISSETTSGSYLKWMWSSRSPPKPVESEPKLPVSDVSDVTTVNGDAIKPSDANGQTTTPKPEEVRTSTPNPLIATLPQTRSSWMSFWARSDSMTDLKRIGPETMQVPENVDPQGRPVKRQKTRDDSSLEISTLEANASVKSPKPTHTPSTSLSSVPNTPTKPPSSPKPETPSKKDKTNKDKIKLPPPPNHVLPSFESTYPSPLAKESLFSRVTRALLPTNATYPIHPGALHARSHHVTPPTIRRAVAIGIHGFFPLRIIRSVIGEPTGTSVKFATLASEAIHRFSDRQYGSPTEIEVVKIALEGEGTVAARIDMLWKNLAGKKEWMDHIREADLILVACHSQGSPVGAGIMARLVEEGIVLIERTRLGLLCVAGIHLGPAIDVGQRVVIKAYNAIESEAARELYGKSAQYYLF